MLLLLYCRNDIQYAWNRHNFILTKICIVTKLCMYRFKNQKMLNYLSFFQFQSNCAHACGNATHLEFGALSSGSSTPYLFFGRKPHLKVNYYSSPVLNRIRIWWLWKILFGTFSNQILRRRRFATRDWSRTATTADKRNQTWWRHRGVRLCSNRIRMRMRRKIQASWRNGSKSRRKSSRSCPFCWRRRANWSSCNHRNRRRFRHQMWRLLMMMLLRYIKNSRVVMRAHFYDT